VIEIAGAVSPANVSVYRKLTSVLATVASHCGFGHSKVAKNSSELVAVALIAGTTSVPFLFGRS
jgi:hypothetical protein